MKKWTLVLLAVMLMGMILWSCTENDSNTEPTDNNAPVINSITSNPTSVQQGGTSTFTCNATDVDGDSLTYYWLSTDGTISGTSSSETWTAPNTTDSCTITCSVSDGELTDTATKIIKVYELLTGLAFVQGGTYQMGDHFSEGYSDEFPVHSVTVSDYYIGATEITQSEWALYMSADTYNYGVGDDYPVYYVSWYEIMVYCNKRSVAEGITPCYLINGSTNPDDWGGVPTSDNSTWNAVVCNWDANGYRLPTEAEWEYASRGGIHNEDNYHYSGWNTIDIVAWYDGNNYIDGSKPVGTKSPNQLEIYDMSGNLYEWCWDWYGDYQSDAQNDPTGATSGTYRVLRGGYWGDSDYYCRIASRNYDDPCHNSVIVFGFRVVRRP